jgi:membrane protein
MTLTQRLDRFQRRHRWAGFPLAVLYKFFDDTGIYLAALMAYYALLSLFPLLLLLTTVLGYALAGDPGLQTDIVGTALAQFPVIGAQLEEPERLGGGAVGLTIGIVGALYGGLGVGLALQNAMNTAWAVPRNRRPNPFAARGRSLLLLCTVGLALLATTALSTFSGNATVFGTDLGTVLPIVMIGVSVLVNAGFLVLAFRLATARDLGVRDVAPGALAAAVVWQLLQSFGGILVTRVVRDSSATNGVFALVLGLIAFLFVAAIAVVLCVEVNVVRVDRLWPRALLTPFTDAVELTRGDERVYTRAARAQRTKGYERVEVRFDKRLDEDTSPGVPLPGTPVIPVLREPEDEQPR